MPYITVEEDVDIEDILSDCSTSELKEAAQYIVREAAENDSVREAMVSEMLEHSDSFGRDIVKNFGKVGRGSSTYSPLEQEHIEKMELLASKFYSLSQEDEKALEEIYQKYR
jgi:hypothetical protein